MFDFLEDKRGSEITEMEMVAAITRWLNCDNGGCAAIMGLMCSCSWCSQNDVDDVVGGAVMIRTKESAAAFANDTEYGEELVCSYEDAAEIMSKQVR